ncbi:MAG: GNAT family N-acetyltransferase [Acidobacteriia bacterium]|nr:GNAT family N-acetyltransferase [Terriglobia bacterium]
MGVLEFMPATRKVLRLLASEPEDFAAEYGVRLHEVAQTVAQHSLSFMKSFPYETSPDWFGHFAIEGETQQLAGVCSLKGPPVDGVVEIAYFTFPGFEGRGIGTEMARFVLERARRLPEVTLVTAHTAPESNASTRILERIGMRFSGEAQEDGVPVWRWEIEAL